MEDSQGTNMNDCLTDASELEEHHWKVVNDSIAGLMSGAAFSVRVYYKRSESSRRQLRTLNRCLDSSVARTLVPVLGFESERIRYVLCCIRHGLLSELKS